MASSLVLIKKGFRVYLVTAAMLKKYHTLNGCSEGDYAMYIKDECMTFDSPEWIAGSMQEVEDWIACSSK